MSIKFLDIIRIIIIKEMPALLSWAFSITPIGKAGISLGII
ncbi:hypothetical protein ACFLWH_01550 [Chloroflexota bacterium]